MGKTTTEIQVTEEDVQTLKSKGKQLLLIFYNEPSKSVGYDDLLAEVVRNKQDDLKYNQLGNIISISEENQGISKKKFIGPRKLYLMDIIDIKNTGNNVLSIKGTAYAYSFHDGQTKGSGENVTLLSQLGAYKEKDEIIPVCTKK